MLENYCAVACYVCNVYTYQSDRTTLMDGIDTDLAPGQWETVDECCGGEVSCCTTSTDLSDLEQFGVVMSVRRNLHGRACHVPL